MTRSVEPNVLTATISLGNNSNGPVDLALNPIVQKLYTSNWTSGNVSVVDIASSPSTLITNIQSGSLPDGVSLNPFPIMYQYAFPASLIYSPSSGGNLVYVIDQLTDKIVGTISVVNPRWSGVNPFGTGS
ncbi:hypothetical protein F3I02_17245 [Bacillus sp. SRB3LM]|nr:hypothetical protein [Bacillus sp. SRB3LM]